MRLLTLFTCLCVASIGGLASAQDWKFDVVHLKNRERFEGLIVSETKEEIRFQRVLREPGAPTRAMLIPISREEIDRIERLSELERKELSQRVDLLDPRGEKEDARMRAVAVEQVAWPGGGSARACNGKHFRLVSNAREDIVRRVAVRLEEIFQAYLDRLGRRRQPIQPIEVLLCKSRAEYVAMHRPGMAMLNPAYYDPQRNQIVAASDLEERAEELEKLKQKHDAQLRELEEYEKKLRRHFHGTPPPNLLSQIRQTRQNIGVANNQNRDTFERLHRPLFSTLYHEAFHAYLDSYLYPAAQGSVPRWLNEGFAQIFESALVETGELRVGHVDPGRLAAVQDALKKKEFPALADILNADAKQFQVAHRSEALRSDRSFQAAWALAYYLTFDRKLLSHAGLDQYVKSLHRGTDAAEAFRDLVGQPHGEFERQFHQFLAALRPDGTLKMVEKK